MLISRRKIEKARSCFYNMDCVEGMNLLPPESVDLIIADPPYGIRRPEQMYNRDDANVDEGYVEAPDDPTGHNLFTHRWVQAAVPLLRPGGSFFVISGWTHGHIVRQNLSLAPGLEQINHIIWKYQFGVWTTRKFVSSHYEIFFYAKKGGRRTFNTEARFEKFRRDSAGSLLYRDLEDVWFIKRKYRPGQRKNQNTLPEELIEKILLYTTNPGDLVLDPFLGGFTTAKVARRLDRRCIGFEVNPNGFEERAHEVISLSGNT